MRDYESATETERRKSRGCAQGIANKKGGLSCIRRFQQI